MAFIDPPIEKVIDMAGSRYALCTVVTKRAKELLLEKPEFFANNQKIKPIEYASREELVKAIKAKYSPEEPQSEENTIPPGSVCVDEEMAMQNEANTQSPKLNTKPHKQEVKV